MPACIHREIHGRSRQECFVVAHLAALLGIDMQTQHRLLDQVFRLFTRCAAQAKYSFQPGQLTCECTHEYDDGTNSVAIPVAATTAFRGDPPRS